MSDFITILENTTIASTRLGVRVTDQFKNITVDQILKRLKTAEFGDKDGSHFIRAALRSQGGLYCAPRADGNTESMARLLVIDCDKHVDSHGEEKDGAPNPNEVSKVLRDTGLGYIIFGSYSYYCRITRYRILLVTKTPYSIQQLSPTAEAAIALININLNDNLLAYASENGVWSQPWYYPRKPANSTIETLYLEYLEGNAFEVCEVQTAPPEIKNNVSERLISHHEISPIEAFNKQQDISALLKIYGYKRVLVKKDNEKWLSPDSISGEPGITVKEGKFFSHHGRDPFHDGYWHDAFDLMRVKEGLTEKEAVIRAARSTLVPDERTVGEYHKKVFKKEANSTKQSVLPDPRPAVSKFQPEMLPEAIRDYIYDVAERQQSAPDFVAIAAIVGLIITLPWKAMS